MYIWYKHIATGIMALALLLVTPSVSQAFEQGDFLIRARGLYIIPDDSSTSLSTVPGGKVGVSSSGTLEFDFSYMWTRHIATELVATISRHKLNGEKSLAGVKVGSTWLLPPCFMFQYHFFPEKKFQPYLGVGVNYTLFYNKHCRLKDTHLKLSNSWGAVGQVGMDVLLCDSWFANIDVKYVQMDTKAHLRGLTHGHLHADINPWLFGIGIGRRF